MPGSKGEAVGWRAQGAITQAATTQPSEEMQKYFDSWDFVSSTTLKFEFGLRNEVDASNLPYKVLALTGQLKDSVE